MQAVRTQAGAKVKDCSNCADKPPAGADYYKTKCAKCKPWEPEHERYDKRPVELKEWQWEQIGSDWSMDSSGVQARPY